MKAPVGIVWSGALKRLLPLALLGTTLVGCRPPESPSYRYALAWGQRGERPGQLREPIGIVVAGFEVFVSDAGNSRIQVFDVDGRFLREFGAEGSEDTVLGRPMHLGVSGNSLYVSDYLNDRVVVFSLAGNPVSSIGSSGTGPGEFDAPSSATVDEDAHVYVADFYNQRIQVVSADGDLIRQLGTTGRDSREPGEFTYPTAVSLFPNGGLVVADAYNHRIQAFDADGSFLWRIPDDIAWADTARGRFDVATSVTVGPENNVYVADFHNHRIQIISEDGRFLSTFGRRGSGPGEFDRPTDVAFDAEGNLYVVDFGNDRIQKFESAPR